MTTHLYVDDAENCAAVPCSQTTPCCELSQALAPGIVDATMHTIIHVAAGAYHGQAQVAVDATRIAILAETGAVLDTLTIGTPVFLSGTSALFVAGLTVATSDLQNTPGVDCLASAGGLWFDDGVIIGYGGSGVHAAECTATVRRSKILRNANGVLAGPGGKILLRNSMIAGPHTGMAASTVGTGQLNLLYTTLTDHNALTDNHLLACELMGPLVIRNSILFDRKPDLLLLPCPYSLETTAYRTGAFELNGNPTIPTDAPNEVFVDFDADLVDLRSTAVTAPLLDYAVWQTEDPQTDIYGAPRPSEPGAPDVPGANLPTR
jgi:hypothetical protein